MLNPEEVAFLSEISELLGDCEAPAPPEAARPEATAVAGPEGLLFASHQLVAETEALLSSCSTPSSDDSKAVPRSQALAERRKTRNANAAKRRLKYCNKIQNERDLLRLQEKELAAELAELQATQSDGRVIFERTKAMSVWKAITTRQLQSRLVAEAERRRLRQVVATRSKLLQELGEQVQQQLQGTNTDGSDAAGQSVPPVGPDDMALFERYVQELDVAYEQVDNILDAWGVNEGRLVSFSPEHKHLRDGEREYFENLGVQLVLFHFEQTCNAVWRSMRLVHRQESRLHYEKVADHENILAVKFRAVCRVGPSGSSSNLLIRIVIQRRVEAGRTLILWRAHTQGEGELSDLQAHETGWSVVRPTDTRTRRAVGMPTAILTFIRFIRSEAAQRCGKKKVGQFSELAETSGNEDGSEIVRMMESLLLDNSRSAEEVR